MVMNSKISHYACFFFIFGMRFNCAGELFQCLGYLRGVHQVCSPYLSESSVQIENEKFLAASQSAKSPGTPVSSAFHRRPFVGRMHSAMLETRETGSPGQELRQSCTWKQRGAPWKDGGSPTSSRPHCGHSSEPQGLLFLASCPQSTLPANRPFIPNRYSHTKTSQVL